MFSAFYVKCIFLFESIEKRFHVFMQSEFHVEIWHEMEGIAPL